MRRIFPIDRKPGSFMPTPLYGSHGLLLTNENYKGVVLDKEYKVRSYAHGPAYVPFCTPAPKDKTWLQEQKIDERSDIHLYLLAMDNLVHGNYRGSMPSLSKYWDTVKNENGIGKNKFPGMA